jgi:hypothetical protein
MSLKHIYCENVRKLKKNIICCVLYKFRTWSNAGLHWIFFRCFFKFRSETHRIVCRFKKKKFFSNSAKKIPINYAYILSKCAKTNKKKEKRKKIQSAAAEFYMLYKFRTWRLKVKYCGEVINEMCHQSQSGILYCMYRYFPVWTHNIYL